MLSKHNKIKEKKSLKLSNQLNEIVVKTIFIAFNHDK